MVKETSEYITYFIVFLLLLPQRQDLFVSLLEELEDKAAVLALLGLRWLMGQRMIWSLHSHVL